MSIQSIINYNHSVIARSPERATKQSIVGERLSSSRRDCFVTSPGFPRNDVLVWISLLCILAVGGCEQIVPTVDLPYVNHLVIKGFLVAGQPIEGISITHTLPLSVTYDSALAATKDARVAVTVDGRTIPLTLMSDGYFGDIAPDLVQSGKSYHITVDWQGVHAEASTLVPNSPQIDSFWVDNIHFDTSIYRDRFPPDTAILGESNWEFSLAARSSEVYELLADSEVYSIRDTMYGYQYTRSYYNSAEDFALGKDAKDGKLRFAYIRGYNDSLRTIFVTLGSFDRPYYDYLVTQHNSEDNGPFGVNGLNPKWNVTGDGIGLFIGMASTKASFTVRR